jgi:EAL domain-containing protein (putative c-di-GMP-specific phosphodiesterase class I)/CheY-like chemotaxis protein
MRLADEVVVGVEALLRWHHPSHGLLMPGAFIPVAEESDLIVEVGTYALQEACRQGRAWRQTTIAADEDFVIWVNVSGAQFSRMDVPATVAQILEANGLEPQSLGLEITESVFAGQTDALCVALTKLRSLGVRIAIDDFGTGFSSLGRLKDLPADVIKIDGSFVRGLGHAAQDSAIVAACVGLSDALGLTAVAECIETTEQFAALVAENCLFGQGYYFSAAVPAEDATRYIRQHNGKPSLKAISDDGSPLPSSPVALVCDDEAAARLLYRSALESAGAEVETVACGAAAVEWAIEHQPDLALVDLRMPGQDGIWTITELRRRCPETRLVLMSADPDLERFGHGLASGADLCLGKDDVIPQLAELLVSPASH